MKRGILSITLYASFFAVLLLWGCGGGGPGSPGSTGSEDTGIRISSVSISRSEGQSQDIDVFSNTAPVCPPDNPTKGEKLLTKEDAIMTIEASKLNPNSTFDPFPASLEECTITYLKAIEDPSSPIIPSWTIYPNCPIHDGSNTCNVQLIDIARKGIYWNAVSGGINWPVEYPTHYVAKYSCKIVNNFGKTQYIETEYDIWLADWLVCE